MDKRAESEQAIWPLIGTTIGALLIIFVALPLGISLYKVFYDKADQGTIESMNAIDNAIRNSENGETIKTSFYINNGLMLVGFNSGKNTIEETCSFIGTDTILKPPVCGSSACLCLCDEGECDSPVKCIIYKEEDKKETEEVLADAGRNKDIQCFTASSEKPNLGGDSECGSGKNLVIYGNCNWAFQSEKVYTLEILNTNDQKIDIKITG